MIIIDNEGFADDDDEDNDNDYDDKRVIRLKARSTKSSTFMDCRQFRKDDQEISGKQFFCSSGLL